MKKENEKIIIVNRKKLKKTKQDIQKRGAGDLYILSDFDRTLTKLLVGNGKIYSLISILRNYNYLGFDYSEKSKAFFKKYHPIEIDQSIPSDKKKKKMQEWWEDHFKLLYDSNFNKKQIEKIINSGNVKLRKGGLIFLDYLYKNKIPLLIISSSGLGGYPILFFLKKIGRLYPNIHVIPNDLLWDKKGKFTGVNGLIIHSMNKDGNLIKKMPIFETIKNRRSIILLGDNTEDSRMINNLKYENLIKIGFLNEEIKRNLPDYKKSFDILVVNDGSMDYVNDLLKELI